MYRRHLLLVLSVCFATTGCTTLTPNFGEIFAVSSDQAVQELKGSEVKTPEVGASPQGPSFVVEMRGAGNESQKFLRPLTEEPIYVQAVLVQSNALKHFGRVKTELWRPRPDGQGYYKIDIPYDRKSKSVPPAFDYQVREGDRLVFMEDESNIFDDMLGNLTG